MCHGNQVIILIHNIEMLIQVINVNFEHQVQVQNNQAIKGEDDMIQVANVKYLKRES